MALLNDKIRQQLSELIGELNEVVILFAFKSDSRCRTCKNTMQYLEEISALNQKIKLKVYDADTDKQQFEKYNILQIPAIIIRSEKSVSDGVRFYGIPSGYEIHSLISSIKNASGINPSINESLLKRLKKINNPVHIRIFVTPTCPNCPEAVINGHTLAFFNPNIICDAVEAVSFPELSQKYNVRGVPKIIINEIHELNGLQPLEKLLEVIEKL